MSIWSKRSKAWYSRTRAHQLLPKKRLGQTVDISKLHTARVDSKLQSRLSSLETTKPKITPSCQRSWQPSQETTEAWHLCALRITWPWKRALINWRLRQLYLWTMQTLLVQVSQEASADRPHSMATKKITFNLHLRERVEDFYQTQIKNSRLKSKTWRKRFRSTKFLSISKGTFLQPAISTRLNEWAQRIVINTIKGQFQMNMDMEICSRLS